MNSYQISLIPLSWALGVWHRSRKTTLAIGPLRLSVSRGVPQWKTPEPAHACDYCGQLFKRGE